MHTYMAHPSKKIIGSVSKELADKKVLLAVTGSVAIYKSLDLARSLMRNGAEVSVIMSKDAAKLISPEMFKWATGKDVVAKLTGDLEHVSLAEDNDVMIIAPSTANTIVKIAYGIADTPITATALNFVGMKKPLIIVPSMHLQMYISPQVADAVNRLKGIGVEIIEPDIIGDLAHYPELEYLAGRITSFILRGKDLSGLNILVTAGPTREYLDSVRFVSNPSSGTMGISIANEAYFRGANVRVICGPISSKLEPYVRDIVRIETTEEMLNEVVKSIENDKFSVVILAGAPADYKFKNRFDSKIDSHTEIPKVELERTPKISEYIRKYNILLVGFSAETVNSDEELVEKAKIKMRRHGFDLIVANNVRRKDIGFSSEYNEVIVIDKAGNVRKIEKDFKTVVARKILDIVKEQLKR
ncbi:bifunctional phosphopantothenoylcysteine decarboxylase/phosphopantothenate--cysteine ligase CoaBC [Sulfolobus sp. E5-1-F]|uniref:bifunctional phosphopantothenoylcysteine decarboxylase/phosphopantothenate--cysteine ligase CoaBC n=1 Tax=Saccharolobus sp. E5-1-F TaxID=2663019 RepID=UPI0012961530|nr:bifunctional phosphopantothenoylcysteine decarboxylase/phosphopantothenate--cysteine ligase CoaBC [Sulfolobus sp. E5-1-F]QGA54986.1 bifunctional phosphopantothenoylcysteine decarboxylase/phosphopantothenate--cysteine ligase CoaBC [Sulfolobus sp. E5-1-F]